MVLDTRRRHSLRIRDVAVISIDKHSGIRQIISQEVCWPELAVCVGPCLERMIIATARIQAVNKDKAMKTQYQFLAFNLVAWYMFGTLGTYSTFGASGGVYTSWRKGNSCSSESYS